MNQYSFIIGLFKVMVAVDFINPVFRNNEVAGAVVIITDVTEKEEREDLRREFSANVSHELKTPLTSISGIAEIIKTASLTCRPQVNAKE